jgi:hypothetical protein
MSGLRDFVTGTDNCTASDGAGPSNAASALANALLGGRSKQKEQVYEVRTFRHDEVDENVFVNLPVDSSPCTVPRI